MGTEAWVVFGFGATMFAFRELCGYLERIHWQRERAQLINKIVSRNPMDYQLRQAADLATKPAEPEKLDPNGFMADTKKLRSRSRPDDVEAAIAEKRDVMRQAIKIIGEEKEYSQAVEK